MKREALLLGILFVVFLNTIGMGTAVGQTSEEVYVREIRQLLITADGYLLEAAEALASCLEAFSECLADPSPVIDRLNASRNGLIEIHATVISLNVPEKYANVNALVIQGLNKSIEGIAFHMEGLRDQSLQKFQTGSDLMTEGREKLEEAADLLRANPPRSSLENFLITLLFAISAILISTIVLMFRWYRRLRMSQSSKRGRE